MPAAATNFCRGVAQLGSAPDLGSGGRWFESSRLDHHFRLRAGFESQPTLDIVPWAGYSRFKLPSYNSQRLCRR